MKFQTYVEGVTPLPNKCWSCFWEPEEPNRIIKGYLILRGRDTASTLQLITIPVGGRRGISEKKASIIADFILEKMNGNGS
jgi:hypothetical protein